MSIKLFIFDSVEDARAFDRREETKPVVEVVTREARPTDPLEEFIKEPPEDKPRKKYTKREAPKKPASLKSKGAGRGKGVMHCKICGEPGRSDSHPNHGPKKVKAEKKLHCTICDGYGHKKKTCPQNPKNISEIDKVKPGDDGPLAGETGDTHAAPPSSLTGDDLHAAVQGLKEDGLSSIQIAQRLKISLKTVNENW